MTERSASSPDRRLGAKQRTDLDGRRVVGLAHLGGVGHAAIPNVDDVVVSSTGEQLRSQRGQLAPGAEKDKSDLLPDLLH